MLRVAKSRKKGPKVKEVKELKSNNPHFDQALFYRTYLLENTSHGRAGRQTGNVEVQIKRLKLTLNDCSFSAEDPILILEFLSRFVTEGETLDMSGAQAFIALLYLLNGMAAAQLRSVQTASPHSS